MTICETVVVYAARVYQKPVMGPTMIVTVPSMKKAPAQATSNV